MTLRYVKVFDSVVSSDTQIYAPKHRKVNDDTTRPRLRGDVVAAKRKPNERTGCINPGGKSEAGMNSKNRPFVKDKRKQKSVH